MIMSVILLIFAIPVGYLIAWMARDELVQGRSWFRVLIILSLLSGLWFYLADYIHISLTSFFITIVSLISFVKSSDKKWTR